MLRFLRVVLGRNRHHYPIKCGLKSGLPGLYISYYSFPYKSGLLLPNFLFLANSNTNPMATATENETINSVPTPCALRVGALGSLTA